MVDDPQGIYMDHASATAIDPRVRDAMSPFLWEDFASPESLHEWARRPADALAHARAQVAALVGARAEEIIFTAGDTEAGNLAVKGIVSANAHRGRHVVASAVSSAPVMAACRALGRSEVELSVVGVDAEGHCDPAAVAAVVRSDTVLVTIPHGQPEIGTVQDVGGVCAAVHDANPQAAIHVDAGATAGLVPVDVDAWGCDALSLGGGTMGGPRWAGALWMREGTRLHPLIDGGLQEAGKRAGAHDVPAIVGLGAAAALAQDELPTRSAAMTAAATRLIDALLRTHGVRLNGPRVDRVPGHVQVSVEGVEGEALTLMLAAAGVACAPGSACSAAGKTSPVLAAIGVDAPWTHSAVLFTLAPSTTPADVDRAADLFAEAVARLRAIAPIERR